MFCFVALAIVMSLMIRWFSTTSCEITVQSMCQIICHGASVSLLVTWQVSDYLSHDKCQITCHMTSVRLPVTWQFSTYHIKVKCHITIDSAHLPRLRSSPMVCWCGSFMIITTYSARRFTARCHWMNASMTDKLTFAHCYRNKGNRARREITERECPLL